MKVFKRLGALAVLPVMALTISSCNNSASEQAAAAPEQGIEVTGIPGDLVAEVEIAKELADQIPEEYRKDGLVFGHSGESMPMNTVQDGVPRGVDLDIARAVSKVLGVEHSFIEVDFDGLIPGLKADRMDIIMSSMADYTERQEQIDFVDYFEMSVSLNVEKSNPEGITTIEDLCGMTVGTVRGTGAEKGLEAASVNCLAAGQEQIEIMAFPDSNAALNALTTQRVVASTGDSPSAVFAAKTLRDGEAVEVVGEPLYGGVFYGAGFLKDDTDLRDSYQAALQHLIDSGWYGRLLEGYGLQDGSLEEAMVNGGGDRPFS